MTPHDLVPTLDPLPLPAPEWLLLALLLVTFFLHIVAMNLLVGGTLAAFVSALGPRTEVARRLFPDLAKTLPSLVAATITLGVAPLLFLQALYGRFFYTSSVLMGGPWMLVLLFLTLAYYALYLVAFRHATPGRGPAALVLAALALLLAVGFTYSNNLMLALTPDTWAATYFADRSGWNLNLGEATLVPRVLHFLVAAAALGGLLVAFLGMARWRGDPGYGRALVARGGAWFAHATFAQVLFGTWFLVSLPREKLLLFMGDSVAGTALLSLGIGCGIAAAVIAWKAARLPDPRRGVVRAASLVALAIASMIMVRHVLREAYLAPYSEPAMTAVQWTVLLLFLAIFLCGVGLWAVMLRRYFRAAPAARTGEPQGGGQ